MTDEKNEFIPLKLSKKDYVQYKEELEKFFLIGKNQYPNLAKSFEILKTKKLHLSFLLFSYYNSWIFPYISYNKIIQGNIFSSQIEISFIFKKLSQNMKCPFDEKLFILWYFYIYYNFFIKEKKLKPNVIFNQMRYILLETGQIITNLFEKNYFSIDDVINIFDTNLLCLEYLLTNEEFINYTARNKKTRKLIFFQNFFFLLKKITIITLKKNKDFDMIVNYLDKIQKNPEFNDEVNIIMLFNNNILQDFMNSIFENMNITEFNISNSESFRKKLINFYSHFLKNKYITSKLFKNFMYFSRRSFEHLYNFTQNKNLIMRDIFINNFNFELLNKLYKDTQSVEIENIKQKNYFFYFDSKSSIISFENVKNISLDQTIIFFSFQIGKNNILNEPELPIILISKKNKKNEKALTIFLKKYSDNNNAEEKYQLLIGQYKDKNLIILNEDCNDLLLDKENFHFCALYINGKKLNLFLFNEFLKKPNEFIKKEIICNIALKEDNYSFYLGYLSKDEKNMNNINFYKGKFGPFIIIKAPKLDILVNKDMDKLISDILLTKENYKDFIINKSNLHYNYSFELKEYFEQKCLEKKEKIDKIKGNFECLLYLTPDFIKFYKNFILNDDCSSSDKKTFPYIYDDGNINNEFTMNSLNATVAYSENIVKLFALDNGVNFIFLILEYFNQVLRYYLLKKNKDEIFNENELNFIIKEIIETIKYNFSMLSNYNYSKYSYKDYKKIIITLYQCILNLNKIQYIIENLFGELISLKDIYRGILFSYKADKTQEIKKDLIPKDKNDYEIINNNNFIEYTISYYLSIIEILLTPELYKFQSKKINIKLIENLVNSIFHGNNEIIYMINLSDYNTIIYKLLSFIELLNTYYTEDPHKCIFLLEKIFLLIFEFLNSKTKDNDLQLTNKYFKKIYLFVFQFHNNDYQIILGYLNAIAETSKGFSNIKFNENRILELKKFLVELRKENKEKENKENNNENKINEVINDISDFNDANISLHKEKIEIRIIGQILEFIFRTKNFSELDKFDTLEDIFQKFKITKPFFEEIKKILKIYLIDMFNHDENINNYIDQFNLEELNIYFQNIFDFIKILFKYLNQNEEKESKLFLIEIYDILLEGVNSIKITFENLQKYTIYLLNYIYFFFHFTQNKELYIFSEEKILQLLEILFDLCIKSSLIYCNYYILIKYDNNTTIMEKKLISESFLEIFTLKLKEIYDIYQLPENKEISEKDINFIKKFNAIMEKKFISEFKIETYDIKGPYIDEYKSIGFNGDFLNLIKEKKYNKKYIKNKDISQEFNFYQKNISIINLMKSNFIDLNNKFEFHFTTYFFYQIYDFTDKINSYINNEEISKYANLKSSLEEVKASLIKLKKILLSDHFKLSNICKDFYSRKYHTSDYNLTNMLKSIQAVIFSKKIKNIEINDLVTNIETEFINHENKSGKGNNPNSRTSGNSSGSSPKIFTSSAGSKESLDIIQPSDLEVVSSENQNIIVVNEQNIKKENNIENMNNNDASFKEKLDTLKFSINNSHMIMNILNKIDKYMSLNPKKELMKNVFGIYFSESFFENETFQKLKNIYLNSFEAISDTKLLNYPSKIKNFMNGLEPSNFFKENSKFFISKIFPITHTYFYDYMIKNNIFNESIILLPKKIIYHQNTKNNSNNANDINVLSCELIKQDRFHYGQLIISEKDKFLFFKKEKFDLFDDTKGIQSLKKDLLDRGFSLSSLKNLVTDNAKIAQEKSKNKFLDTDIFENEDFHKNKKIIIFYDDIDEIIERRIIYLWQGLEILLKNGKSYLFNMLKKENFENISDKLKKIPNIFYRDKDFFQKMPIIMNSWRSKKIDTFEYLLYINKYGSRSFNDTSQYYIFPWILRSFDKLIEINNKENEIFEYKLKHKLDKKENEKSNKTEEEKIILDLHKNFRNFKYPISAQELSQRQTKIEKYRDEDEVFNSHHGTHYSTAPYLFYYLMRIEPYTDLLVELQNYAQEDPNRLLLNLKDTIKIIDAGYDNRELIPELFCKIDCFVNVNCAFFGYKKNMKLVDDINWTRETYNEKKYNQLSVYSEFIIYHKKLLNSDIVSSNINKWIDNIFGYMQNPSEKKKEKSINIFPKSTYEKYYNINNKIEKLFKKHENSPEKIIKKFVGKINVIINFGQCPQQIFLEKHKSRENNNENEIDNEENTDNYGLQDDYLGKDFIDTYMMEGIKNDNKLLEIKLPAIYFEINSDIDKIFLLSEASELCIINTNFYNHSNPTKYNWGVINKIKLPKIYFFNKIKLPKNINYYIYNVKYAFSSFSLETNDKYNLYSNVYLNSLQNNINTENKYEQIKFITCRHLDNSFKIHFASINQKKKKLENIETGSYICEDFVMCCKAFTNDKFIIGLRNGKLIKAKIIKFEVDKNDKKNKKLNHKYKILVEKYITGHEGSVNVLEIYNKQGIIITCGDDNKIFIRKLYDFELLTCIKLKPKFIITMAKVSPVNLLYLICFNRKIGKSIIFGYSLSGLKFAKSSYAYYKNIEFTKSGNIIYLTNELDIKLLYGHNLNEIEINEKDKDYKKFDNVNQSFKANAGTIGWMQFNDFKNEYGTDRSIISYICKESSKKEENDFKTLKVTNISYFE